MPDVDKSRAATDPQLSAAVMEAQTELGIPAGFCCDLRHESLVRVMVEAESYEVANGVAHPSRTW